MSTPISPTLFPPSRLASVTSGVLDGSLDPALNYTWAGIACLVAFFIYATTRTKPYFDVIPAIGRTGLITSYLDMKKYEKRGDMFINEGYAKYQNGIFRVPDVHGWHVMVSGPKLIEEVRKAPDDVLSFKEGSEETLATRWTLGTDPQEVTYHISIIRNQLTRNIGNLFPYMRDELVLAFDENIPPTEEWTKVNAVGAVMKIVSRVTNRIFVGPPACRNPEYTALCVQFTVDAVLATRRIFKYPKFLRPIIGRIVTKFPEYLRDIIKHLRPIIEERRQKIAEYGPQYPDKPVDLLSWLLDDMPEEVSTNETIARYVLGLNFAAIHTSSTAFTHALYELAYRREYIEPIREEVEAAIAEYGWTKAAIGRMRKLDSFLKEAQRIHGSSVSLTRMAVKDFVFSDGRRVPKGTLISAVMAPRQLDDKVYPDATTFKGFRFSGMREEEGEETKNQMVATSVDYLNFGHGKHACPGRFFAVNELKAMMAHVVVTYDFMINEIPEPIRFGIFNVPNPMGEVLFRKRRA